MRLVSIMKVEPGMRLAKPIYSDTGITLIAENVELSTSMITRLQQLGIDTVYVRDVHTDDIEIQELISPETRRLAMQNIKQTFQEFSSNKNWRHLFRSGGMEKSFRPVIDSIIAELMENKKVLDLASALYVANEEVYSHSFNVTIYTTALGIKQNLSRNQMFELGIGAILHDIGKMMVPENILSKPGKLSKEEFEEIKRHSEYGFNVLRTQENIPLVSAHMAFQHHERVDGTGYPRGISGKDIHPYSKILSVADVYDALTCHRVYRPAMLPHDAIEIIYAGSGTQFEQSMVEHFRDSVALYPIGITVELSNGESGVVVDYNQNFPSRPIIRILFDQEKQPTKPFEIDLSKHLNITITGSDAR